MILSGISTGGVYGLIALGLALPLGVLRAVNLGHGALVLLCPLLLSLPSGPGAMGPGQILLAGLLFALPFLLWRSGFRPMSSSSGANSEKAKLALVVIGVGLMAILEDTGPWLVPGGLLHLAFMDPIGNTSWSGVPLPRIIALGFSGLVYTFMYAALRYTDTGRSLIAASQDPESAIILGVDLLGLYKTAFFITIALTYISGIILAAIMPVTAFMSMSLTIKSLIIISLAGYFRMLRIIIIAIAFGVAETIFAFFFGEEAKNIFVYSVFLLIIRLGRFFKKET